MRILPSVKGFDLELSTFVEDARVLRGAVSVPPSNNMGGNYFPPPIPFLTSNVCQKTKVDYLSFTSSAGIVVLKIIVSLIFPDALLTRNTFSDGSDRGFFGYPSSYSITLHDCNIGLIAFGCDHGKDFVSFSGKGCSEWSTSDYAHVTDCLETVAAKITRIDICMDFYKGEVSYEYALMAYFDGEFNPAKAGRKFPVLGQQGTQEGAGVNLGRTMYVGSTSSSKRACLYEKGLQIFSKMPVEFRESCTNPSDLVYDDQNCPVGTIAEQWFRVEIRWGNKDLDLPVSMLLNRDEYFTGAYPFCAKILDKGDGIRPSYLKKSEEIDNEKMIQNCRNGYGNAIHTWLACGFTDRQIIQWLDTGKHNARLVASGVVSKLQAVEDFSIPF
jgi:DNA relaxase NicK